MNPESLFLILTFIFGACIGSFLNVVIWRLPRDEKLTGRSHCASCLHKLEAADLFPLLSFVLLKGQCKYCKKPISFRYPFIETLTGLLFAFAFWHFLPFDVVSWLFLFKTCFAIAVLIAVFVIDLEHFLILDSLVYPSIAFLLPINFLLDYLGGGEFLSLNSAFLGGILAAILAALPFFLIWFFSKGTWMGFGDVKLALFLGQFFGLTLVWVNLFGAIILGGVLSIILLVFGGKNMKTKLPFGSFLAIAAILTIFYGAPTLDWYLGMLGF